MREIGVIAVGNKNFGAVDQVMIALAYRPRPDTLEIGTGARFRHGEAADMIAGDQLRQVAGLLFGGAPAGDLVDAEV